MSAIKQHKERRGRVVAAHAGTFSGLESVARKGDAKGCFFDRGMHRDEMNIARWLKGMEEDELRFGEFAAAQLQVAPECDDGGCGEIDCKDAACETTPLPTADILQEEDIRDACAHLVAELPASFREDVRTDAEALASMFLRLCPGVPWLTLRLEVAQFNACSRWHQDNNVGRAIICYVGPGTCAADDSSVRWDQFAKTMYERTNESCVPTESVKQMKTNTVLLMKGDQWPGICGSGLTHKAPDVLGDSPPKRLLLKVDLHRSRPPLGSDEESSEEDDDDGGEEDDDQHSEEDEDDEDKENKKRRTQ